MDSVGWEREKGGVGFLCAYVWRRLRIRTKIFAYPVVGVLARRGVGQDVGAYSQHIQGLFYDVESSQILYTYTWSKERKIKGPEEGKKRKYKKRNKET